MEGSSVVPIGSVGHHVTVGLTILRGSHARADMAIWTALCRITCMACIWSFAYRPQYASPAMVNSAARSRAVRARSSDPSDAIRAQAITSGYMLPDAKESGMVGSSSAMTIEPVGLLRRLSC